MKNTPIDSYIARCDGRVRPILRRIRAIIREEAPDATERLSYRMPAFFDQGALIYFAPFTSHIGIYPPIKGTPALNQALAGRRGPKGNLKFPLDAPIPYGLIRRVVRCRIREHRAHVKAKRR